MLVCITIPSFDDPFFVELGEMTADALAKQNLTATVRPDGDADLSADLVDVTVADRVDDPLRSFEPLITPIERHIGASAVFRIEPVCSSAHSGS